MISFLLIPLTLDYLNPYEYGIWLTLNSVLSWVYLFDIGLGNGLRNRLAEALAKGDNALGKIYVSTTYFCMTVIISIIYLLFLVAQNWLDWYEILNVEADKVERLNFLVTVLFGFFCLRLRVPAARQCIHGETTLCRQRRCGIRGQLAFVARYMCVHQVVSLISYVGGMRFGRFSVDSVHHRNAFRIFRI